MTQRYRTRERNMTQRQRTCNDSSRCVWRIKKDRIALGGNKGNDVRPGANNGDLSLVQSYVTSQWGSSMRNVWVDDFTALQISLQCNDKLTQLYTFLYTYAISQVDGAPIMSSSRWLKHHHLAHDYTVKTLQVIIRVFFIVLDDEWLTMNILFNFHTFVVF